MFWFMPQILKEAGAELGHSSELEIQFKSPLDVNYSITSTYCPSRMYISKKLKLELE